MQKFKLGSKYFNKVCVGFEKLPDGWVVVLENGVKVPLLSVELAMDDPNLVTL